MCIQSHLLSFKAGPMTTFALSLPEDDEYSDCECLTEVKLTFIVI